MRNLLYIVVLVLNYKLKLVECQMKICPSIDIRNNITCLSKLDDCEIIFGSLKIVLIDDRVVESDYDMYSFPKLVEITEYLLLFNVHNLTTLGRLFPNLRVIRGNKLIRDYSLIIFDMPHMLEIGLSSLVHIERGAVKIDKCPQLCYANTINWDMIGTVLDYHDSSYRECPCASNCKGHCWNWGTCQIPDTDKCHEECLGCTKYNSSQHCKVCKHYNDTGTCVANCPSNKLVTRGLMKCVTEQECYTLFNDTWMFGDECVSSCPAKYEQVDPIKGGCRRCKNDFCQKRCPGGVVETLEHLQLFSGCTIIEGSLHIKMSRPMTSTDLEQLSLIDIIQGSLRIQRVNSITSLSFLRNLKTINGTDLIYNRYALFVSDNPNLRKLWNYSEANFSLEIKNGTIGFHYNSQLCLSEIRQFARKLKLNESFVSNDDVSLTSNGDKSICNLIDLRVNITNVNSTNITLYWDESTLHKESYLGYIVYYTVDPYGNASTIDSQEVCEARGWNSVYTPNNTILLKNLRAFTQYAYYLKMYPSTNSTEVGGQTNVGFFKTLPMEPSDMPSDGPTAEPLNSSSIKLEWKPPTMLNGILSHYSIYYYKVDDEVEYYDKSRNFCLYPATENEKVTVPPPVNSTTPTNSTCQCTKNVKKKLKDEYQILMKDLHRKCLGSECNQFKYETENNDFFQVNKRNSVKKAHNTDVVEIRPKYFEYNTKDPNLTSHIFTNLSHFTMYAFFLRACNVGVSQCSNVVYFFARTKKSPEADDIRNFDVSVIERQVRIKWTEPPNPNGVIVAYNIYLFREETRDQHYKPLVKNCITRLQHQVNNNIHTIENIPPGMYKLYLQAVSLAGPSRFTKPTSVIIDAPINHAIWISIIVIVFFITTGLVTIYFYNRRPRRFQDIRLIATVNPDYTSWVTVDQQWELQRDDVELDVELGRGTFGRVYSGRIKSRNQLCAVKTVNEGVTLTDCIEFLNEAMVMKSLSDAHHVVKLLGVVSIGQPPLVAMELMARGDLKSYLRRTRDSSSQNITSNEIYRMAIEIADGMAYLAAKKFVHRDLAARNCMVAHDRTVKVGDFGMARDIYVTDYYVKETRGLMPVRWMAPESLADGVFTSLSDVWSYGIVLWEISTLAEQPYQGLSNEQVLQFVISRGKLQAPRDCTDLTYELMNECWKWRASERPTFGEIVERLVSHVGRDFKVVSYHLNRPGHEYMNTKNGEQRTYLW